MSYAVEACPDCGHSMMTHSNDGCWHHDAGVICGCMVLSPQGAQPAPRGGSWDESMTKLVVENMQLKGENRYLQEKVTDLERRLTAHRIAGLPELLEKLRVQTERAERLDKENDARFTKETEYQNRIRALEQRLRDVASYAARDLPQR